MNVPMVWLLMCQWYGYGCVNGRIMDVSMVVLRCINGRVVGVSMVGLWMRQW